MLNINKSKKFIWAIFIAVTIFELIDVIGNYLALGLFKNPILIFLKYTLPLVALIPHALVVLGRRKGAFFLLLSFIVGLAFEMAGVKYGVVFGGSYAYRPSALMIGGVPLLIPVYWTIFIYTGYSVVNLFLFWLDKNKPDKFNKNILLLLGLIALDGLAVLSIDLFLEPIRVAEGFWTWSSNGPYFGIPTGNFIGWFTVAITVAGIFRIVEYFFPARAKNETVLQLIPLAGYFFLFVSTFVSALKYNFLKLTFTSSALMLLFILANIFLMATRKKRALNKAQV